MDTVYPADPTAPTLPLPAARDESRRLTWLIAGLVALGLIVLALTWLLVARNQTHTAVATRRNITAWESARAEILAPANKIAVINCRCSAPVSRVFTSVGATVHPGDILVELAHPTARVALEAAQVELRAARQAYNDERDRSRAILNEAKRQLAEAERQLQLAQAQPPATAPGEVPTGMEMTEGDGEPPASGGPVLPIEVAQANAEHARLAVADATAAMQENIAPYAQRLQAAQTAYEEARGGLNAAFIRTPITGQVIELNAQPGRDVMEVPNSVVAVVADLGSLKAHAPLTDEQAERVNPDMPVELHVPSLPREVFEGRVERLQTRLSGLVTEQEREIKHVAVISFVNRQGMVKPNMTAQARIEVAQLQQALTIPVRAVDRDENDQPFVRVREKGRWVRRQVTTGPSDGRYVSITSGLREGEVVRVAQKQRG